MIKFLQGDIFESGCDLLVNPVNLVGVMGAGLALEFKNRYPKNYWAYKEWCRNRNGYDIVFFFQTRNIIICNLATKYHWNQKSNKVLIDRGLTRLTNYVNMNQSLVNSVAIPALGCGLGGLDWNEVKPMIVSNLSKVPTNIQVLVYEPQEK